jgi:hypothetical protein
MTKKLENLLQERGRFWQRALRLQDWEIFYSWGDVYHVALGIDAEANICMKIRHKAAKIVVRVEDNHASDSFRPYDLDRLIVHELLHLTLLPLGVDEDSNDEEQIVEVLSSQIVALWRGQIK